MSDIMIAPGATIGILGGGQLGRMIVLAAANLGYQCHIFEPQASCPASQVARHTSANYDDWRALKAFAADCDVITLEFENVPVDAVNYLNNDCDTPVYPGAHVLRVAQDRALEKTFLNNAGIATAPWAEINSLEDLTASVKQIGRPSVLKTARGGYDGKGQLKIDVNTDLTQAWHEIGQVKCVLEGFIDFTMEISVIAARNLRGDTSAFDVVENQHKNHILDKTIVPANISNDIAHKAMKSALTAVNTMDVVGLLAIEMFVTPTGDVLVNEVAPRPHNSGHWTQDTCVTSQFEQLVRAVCNLPLGSVERLGDAEMQNLLGNDIEDWTKILAEPGAHLHLYGKADAKIGRKMGHINRLIKKN